MRCDDLAEIASAISHELRNPIAAIRALAQSGSAMYEGLRDDDRKEFFRLIDEEARRLSRVADAAATALKIEAGSLAYDLREASLAELVRETSETTPHGEHPLRVEADGDPLVVRIDRARMSDVVAELVDNAARYSPPHAPIAVHTRRQDGRAVIEICDDGPGIAPERRGDVFARFSRVRPKGYEDVPGAGLGLFICRAHVEAHGGHIAVDEPVSGGASGTTLRIELPLER